VKVFFLFLWLLVPFLSEREGGYGKRGSIFMGSKREWVIPNSYGRKMGFEVGEE